MTIEKDAASTPVQVINLARSPERRQRFVDANPNLHYAFHPAVDGRTLDDVILRDPSLFIEPLAFPGAGAYGAALSHRALWDLAIGTQSVVTVAEDDAVFRADFAAASTAVLASLPPLWDFVLWGWNFNAVLSVLPMGNVSPVFMLFDQDRMRAQISAFRRIASPCMAFRLDKCFGIPAYSISPKGAQVFKDACFPMQDFRMFIPVLNEFVKNTGIDMAMNRAYPGTESYAVFPPLVVTPNDIGASTIQGRAARPA